MISKRKLMEALEEIKFMHLACIECGEQFDELVCPICDDIDYPCETLKIIEALDANN